MQASPPPISLLQLPPQPQSSLIPIFFLLLLFRLLFFLPPAFILPLPSLLLFFLLLIFSLQLPSQRLFSLPPISFALLRSSHPLIVFLLRLSPEQSFLLLISRAQLPFRQQSFLLLISGARRPFRQQSFPLQFSLILPPSPFEFVPALISSPLPLFLLLNAPLLDVSIQLPFLWLFFLLRSFSLQQPSKLQAFPVPII